MATRESIARRRDESTNRIARAVDRLQAVYPDAPTVNLTPSIRNLDERNAAALEGIADVIEYLVSQAVSPEPVPEPAPEPESEPETEPESPTGETTADEASVAVRSKRGRKA